MIRKSVVQALAEGAINALTNINGGSTHCNVTDWMFWKESLNEEELKELYRLLLDGMIEVYAKNGVTLEQFHKLLPPDRRYTPQTP